MKKYTLKQKIRYYFDNLMSKGTLAMVLILFVVTILIVVLAGLAMSLVLHSPAEEILSNIWISLLHTVDSGVIADDQGSLIYITIMIVVTLCGLFITSVLIGIINTGLENRMEELRKGKSEVLEENHTIILGFGSNIYTIITELIEANSNHKNMAVVIMDSEMSKSDMEDEIKHRIKDTKTTKIICRSGDVSDFSDLSICGFDRCNSVIINTENDFTTIKAILAVANILKKCGNNACATAVIIDEQNYEAAKIAGDGYVEILSFNDIIARIIAHTLWQPGLSEAFTELFDYGGSEIYIEKVDGLENKKMCELNLWLPNSTVIGIVHNDKVMINPNKDMLLEKNDKLITIAEDDGLAVPSESEAKVDYSLILKGNESSIRKPQNILILGYANELNHILFEEDNYVASNSIVTIGLPLEYADKVEEIHKDYNNINLNIRLCDIYDKDNLKELFEIGPEAVLILSNKDLEPSEEDAKTLFLLLHIKALSEKCGKNFSITSEMQLAENRELASVMNVYDFVVSSNITSLIMTQISQTRELSVIFKELLSSDGSELYIKPVGDYVKLNENVDMYTVGMATALKNEICIGIRRPNGEGGYDIIINMPKNTVYNFNSEDTLIVIAED